MVKAILRGDREREDPLAEVRSLAGTAGLEVADCLWQRLDRPHPATYLGKGKVEEVAERAEELDVDLVVADNDLSPAQERNLEKRTGRTVIDRSALIMDIFAQRAESHQAKLQVELAQLRYTRPRLKRLWTHLSRYEGGIGMRGPGETQLETDKRIVARRIQKLGRELAEIERRKEISVARRDREFVVALVGYTNAGKSTLLNRLTGSTELVEDKLFATLDTRVRRWPLDDHRQVLVSDTVGFIRDLPHHLIASFHATLAETIHADLLLHVVDASSPDAPWQVETVRRVLGELECADRPTWTLLNKWDAVSLERMIEARSLGFRARPRGREGEDGAEPGDPAEPIPESFTISGRAGEGIDELREALLAHLARRDRHYELVVPHDRGDVLAWLRENARIEPPDYRPEAVRVRFEISPAREARLRGLFPEGFSSEEGPSRRPREPWESDREG